MRIAAGAIAMGVALVAACSTPAPVQEMGTPGKFSVMQLRDKMPAVEDKAAPAEVDKAKPADLEKAKPADIEKAKPADVEKPADRAKPEGEQPGQKQAQKPGEPPGQQPGGGGGPQMDQQAVQKVSQALNVNVVSQAQASNLQQIDQDKIKLDVAQQVTGTLVNGVAPQILDIIRPNIANIRFSVRNGLFVPMMLVGTSYMPVVATISGRTAAVIFVQDCASGQLIPNTILI